MVLPMPTSSAISSRRNRQAQRHQQRHELIGARLEADARRRAEWSGTPSQRQPKRIGQQPRAVLGGGGCRQWQTETRWLDRLAFQRGMKDLHVALGAGERPQARASGSGEGSTTHSRPRAQTRSPGVNTWLIPPCRTLRAVPAGEQRPALSAGRPA